MSDDETPDPRFAGPDWYEVWRSLSTEADPMRIPYDAAWWDDYERRMADVPDGISSTFVGPVSPPKPQKQRMKH